MDIPEGFIERKQVAEWLRGQGQTFRRAARTRAARQGEQDLDQRVYARMANHLEDLANAVETAAL